MPLFGPPMVAIARQFPDCPRCGRDLTGLAEKAMFCPGCGRRLHEEATWWSRATDAAAAIVYHVSFGKFGRLPTMMAPPGDALIGRTPILIGYSNALFNLGWRYERGGGLSRNLPEAMRCYRKSARLGNPDAISRLAPGEPEPAKPVIPIRTPS